MGKLNPLHVVVGLPLVLTAVWLPLRSGGEDRPALLFVQLTCFLGVTWLALREPELLFSALRQRIVQILLIGATIAVLSTALSLDRDASFPLMMRWLWLAAVAVLAVAARGAGIRLEWLAGMMITALVIQIGWSFFVWWGGGEAATVQSGTFFAPNQYAGYLLLLSPLLLTALLMPRPWREAAAWGTIAALCYLGLWLSGSRAGIVAGAIGATLVIGIWALKATNRTAIRSLLLVLGGMALLWVLTGPLVMETTDAASATPIGVAGKEGTTVSSLQMRAQWARGAVRIFTRAPALGTGPGTFGDMLVVSMDPTWHWSRYAHNDYLEALAESGPLMLGVMLALPIYPLMLLLRTKDRDPWKIGLAGGVMGAAAHGFMDHDWSFAGWAATYVLAITLLAMNESLQATTTPPRWLRPTILAVPIVAILITLSAAVGIRIVDEGLGPARTAGALMPYSTRPLLTQDAFLDQNGELGRREELLRRASAIDGLDPFILWRLADVQTKAGKTDAAAATYTRALRISLNSPTGYRLAAQFELERDQPGRAAGILDAGISRLNRRPTRDRLSGEVARLFLLRAEAELRLTGPGAALGYAGAAARTAPSKLEAWEAIVDLACKAGAPQTARSGIQEASESLRPDQIQQLETRYELECRPIGHPDA